MNEKQPRSMKVEQLATVKKAFTVNEIDLAHLEAVQTLYQSVRQGKTKAGTKKGYESVEYRLQHCTETKSYTKVWIR